MQEEIPPQGRRPHRPHPSPGVVYKKGSTADAKISTGDTDDRTANTEDRTVNTRIVLQRCQCKSVRCVCVIFVGGGSNWMVCKSDEE